MSFIGIMFLGLYNVPTSKPMPNHDIPGYKNFTRRDQFAAWVGGTGALGVALFPTSGTPCEDHATSALRVFQSVPNSESPDEAIFDFFVAVGADFPNWVIPHQVSAILLYAVLAYFCLSTFRRTHSLDLNVLPQAIDRKGLRNKIYSICGMILILSIALLMAQYFSFSYFDEFLGLEKTQWDKLNLTYWIEAIGLWAFGVAWITKGRLFKRLRDDKDPLEVLRNLRSPSNGSI